MKYKYLIFPCLMVLFISCDSGKSSHYEQAKENITETTAAISQEAKEALKETKKNAEELKAEIDRQIAVLDQNMQEASVEVKEEYAQRRAQLVQWGEEIEAQTQDLGEEVSDNWESFIADSKAIFENIRKELNNQVTREDS